MKEGYTTRVIFSRSRNGLAVLGSLVLAFVPGGLARADHLPQSVLNPAISAIGWFQGSAGRAPSPFDQPAFALKEMELGVQSVVDPFARADAFIAVEGDGEVELEEAYLTWLALPGGLQARTGKFRAGFGKFNQIHPPETWFADRPLFHQRFFGKEGVAGPGVEVSWLVPADVYLEAKGEVIPTPKAEEAPAFDRAQRRDLLYLGRLGTFLELGEEVNMTAGVSGGVGANGFSFDPVADSSSTLRSRMAVADVTLRWKNPRRAIYRSLTWQTELLGMWRDRDPGAGGGRVAAVGLFSAVDLQFARRWHLGGRYDYTARPDRGEAHDRGGLASLTFTPSEFSSLSLQGKRIRTFEGETSYQGFLKMTFNIGPHGAHPF